ncbi:MAG TPA: RidA family protein [Pedomonas sp.]|uniref:RidA family protein n=1 Tax=Pedomonas sp. TaxID=2976421 RepID=UPI002F40060F
MSVEQRLRDLGLSLPTPAAPAANYVPYVISGNLLVIAGQLPLGPEGIAVHGKVGETVTTEQATEAARLCALNLIAQMKAAVGDLERVVRVVRLGGFVNCVDTYADQPKVVNGASDLMVEVFGDKGKHARTAVGTNSLPFNVPVEVDAMVEIA